MTDQRPQYGEYATPEEQRRLAGLPPLDAVVEAQVSAEAVHAAPATLTAPAPAAPKPRSWDRIITIAMLAYGMVSVFITGMAYLDLPTLMNESMKILGVEGEFTNFAQGKFWGTIAAVILVAGWVATAWISLRRLRTGKLTWWVPLVGAAVTMIIVSICLAVPMMNDPAFVSYLDGTTQP
ncbi:DUF6264 family protein [Microbacterium sp. A84]|uniref:DUF6264 family protein n=1 Tax=Microbacterium sp. A84 TaxID=3450715 RepID=UPI003F41D58E